MFWKKKKKLPITEEDIKWIDSELNWLKESIGENHFLEIKTITPTTDFYNRKFQKNEEDAKFILQRTMELMSIKDVEIKLEFYTDSILQMEGGSILATSADLNGITESSAGTYQQVNDEFIIAIEIEQLKDPISLIATISHELSHYILLGEKRIDENDEFLTDLTAIVYGFGVFIGNSRFNFSQFGTNEGFGWQSSSQGYLPEQIIAYAMAWLSKKRNEKTEYQRFLNPSMKNHFEKSLNYLTKINE